MYFTFTFIFYAMLKMTNVELELITNSDMALFIKKVMGGVILQYSNRYAKVKNIYKGSNYNPELPTTFLMYFDVNNF